MNILRIARQKRGKSIAHVCQAKPGKKKLYRSRSNTYVFQAKSGRKKCAILTVKITAIIEFDI